MSTRKRSARWVAAAAIDMALTGACGGGGTGDDTETPATDTLDATVRPIDSRWPRSAIQVRGHTDAASGITSVGPGSSQPFAEESNEEGRKFNRRAEIVLRVP